MENIKTIEVENEFHLYCHYSQQIERQPCFFEIDCGDRTIRCDYDAEIGGGVPFRVWHKRALRFDIPCVTGSAANEFMADDRTLELVTAIVDGFECVWDGSNWVGKYTETADEARSDLEDHAQTFLSQYPEIVEWNAREWFEAEGMGGFIAAIGKGEVAADVDAIRTYLGSLNSTDYDGSPLILRGLSDYAEKVLEAYRESREGNSPEDSLITD